MLFTQGSDSDIEQLLTACCDVIRDLVKRRSSTPLHPQSLRAIARKSLAIVARTESAFFSYDALQHVVQADPDVIIVPESVLAGLLQSHDCVTNYDYFQAS